MSDSRGNQTQVNISERGTTIINGYKPIWHWQGLLEGNLKALQDSILAEASNTAAPREQADEQKNEKNLAQQIDC